MPGVFIQGTISMKEIKRVKYKEWDCILYKDKYTDNGRTALILLDEHDYETVSVATVNVPEARLEPSEVIIKNYSENEGMLEFLVREGIVQDTGKKVKTVKTGYVDTPVCKLLV
jgi:hypothetical protein